MAAVDEDVNKESTNCVSVEILEREKKLSSKEKIELLKSYKEFPVLWNSAEKSPGKKAQAANELAAKHGLSSEGLKKVLHSLRTSMTREVKKKLEQDDFVSTWQYYEHMKFLEDEITKSLKPEKDPWTEDETVALIDFYRENPCIWNHGSARYRDRNAKTMAMERLKESLKRFTEEEIKRQWHTMKTLFDKENKREKGSKKSGAGTADVYESEWKYFHLLTFVKDCPDVDDSTSTLSITQLLVSEGEPPMKIKRSKAQKEKEVHDARLDFYKMAIDALKVPDVTLDTPVAAVELTEEDSFGQMVGKTLARFNMRQRAIARKKISDILFEVEMEENTSPAHSMFSSHLSGSFYNQLQNNTSFNPVPRSDNHYTY